MTWPRAPFVYPTQTIACVSWNCTDWGCSRVARCGATSKWHPSNPRTTAKSLARRCQWPWKPLCSILCTMFSRTCMQMSFFSRPPNILRSVLIDTTSARRSADPPRGPWPPHWEEIYHNGRCSNIVYEGQRVTEGSWMVTDRRSSCRLLDST
jgi:hypothetical protein